MVDNKRPDLLHVLRYSQEPLFKRVADSGPAYVYLRRCVRETVTGSEF